MKDYPRLFPIWFLSLILLIIIIIGPCGCKTGGSWIGSGSAGTIIKGKTPEQMNEEAAARRFQNAQPVQSPQVILPPARSKPKDTSIQSVEGTNVAGTPEAAGEITPFSPTISDTSKNIELPTAKANPLPTKIVEGDGGCVIITDERVNPKPLPKNPESPNNQPPTEVEEKAAMEIDWVRLVMFYVIGFLIIAFAYISWDIFKTYKKKAPTKKTARKKNNQKN
tara:strand:+ start:2295 stop:2963 length:669 start_codon:yes stop_codon:yes gene_type:complete